MKARALGCAIVLTGAGACHDFDAAAQQCLADGRCLPDGGAPDAGGGDGGGDDGGADSGTQACTDDAGNVNGTFVVNWISEDGGLTALVPDASILGAIAPVACDSGTVVFTPGTVDAAGRYTIVGIPKGPYSLVAPNVLAPSTYGQNLLIETQTRSLRVQGYALGRPDSVTPASTQIVMNVTGLSPWDAGNTLYVSAPNAGLANLTLIGFVGEGFVDGGPRQGVSSLPAALFNYIGQPSLDANAGDHLYLIQAGPISGPDVGEQAIAAGVSGPLTTSPGGVSGATFTMQPLAPTGFTATWSGTAFDTSAHAAGPGAAIFFHEVSIVTQPAGLFNYLASAPGLADRTIGAGRGPVPLSFAYVNPFPPGWTQVGHTVSIVFVYPFGPDGGSSSVVNDSAEDLSTWGQDGGITPVVSPPLNLQVNGNPGYLPVSGTFNTQPVLSWTPPLVGDPSIYVVQVTKNGSTTSVSFATTGTSLTVPAGFLQLGTTYLISVRAVVSSAWTADHPIQMGLPFGYATAMFGAYTP